MGAAFCVTFEYVSPEASVVPRVALSGRGEGRSEATAGALHATDGMHTPGNPHQAGPKPEPSRPTSS